MFPWGARIDCNVHNPISFLSLSLPLGGKSYDDTAEDRHFVQATPPWLWTIENPESDDLTAGLCESSSLMPSSAEEIRSDEAQGLQKVLGKRIASETSK